MTTPKAGRDDRDDALGVPFEAAAAGRDRLADEFGIDYGRERVFDELVAALLEELEPGSALLEVGAATGVLTRRLLPISSSLTAMEVSSGMLDELLASDLGKSQRLHTLQGIVEELERVVAFDAAVVTFTPRRGLALVQLLLELATRVSDRIVFVFGDEQSMDWAYLARSAAARGFDVRVRLVCDPLGSAAALVTVRVAGWEPTVTTEDDWGVDARELCVPFPAPRGAAARLVRYFLSAGDRALLVTTAPEGMQRLYGNLRTAAHRLGRAEVTVRLYEGSIQLVRLPRSTGLDTDEWPLGFRPGT